ncbi:hypothetical protein LAZ67_12001793 [Cordylochernes scorpioides]|uniref:CCHC-type domain-containing protein n=1 Tax=Cordylochernes scorpioides TaxID=51811 RepID=A0ABY6L232_9ARAC|nr:hypothetical protein LAZ67_12001793 [Cordylochernes scorpioides]
MAIFEEQRICIKFCFKLKKKSDTETYELIKEAFGDAALSLRLKRPERWQNNDWILHVGNARPHTAHVVLQFLAKHSTIQIPHPPYSPDLAPNDFFLYPKLKINLKGRKFDNVDMIQAESKATLRNLSKSDFISCFDNWKKRWNGRCVVQLGKASGQVLVGLERPEMAENIIEDGLMIMGALLKTLPYQKKAEKDPEALLPGGLHRPCRYFFRRLHLAGPEKDSVVVTAKGGSALAYLEYGFRCSKCYRMGHKRTNCPRIIREASTIQPSSQKSSVKRAPAPNTTAAASPPAELNHPAPVAVPAQTFSTPPTQEAKAPETEPTTRTPETSTQTDLNISRGSKFSHRKSKDRARSLFPKAGSTALLQINTLLERLPRSPFGEITLLGLKEEEKLALSLLREQFIKGLGGFKSPFSNGSLTSNHGQGARKSFRLACLNVRGIAARHRSIELCCFLGQNAVDVAFIQETYVTALDSAENLYLGYRAEVVPASGARGSVLACIFSSGVQVIGQRVLSPGKIAAFDVTIWGIKATFINCHLSHPPDERLQQLHAIAAAAVNEDAWVLGDLNISEESASYIASGSVEALGELLDRANLIDAQLSSTPRTY